MTVAEWVRLATETLRFAGIESPALEAQVLAAHTVLRDRTWVLTHGQEEFPELAGESLLQRRLQHEPLAYILGYREFYGRRFSVTPATLIPRQETEHLVEIGLAHIQGTSSPEILDIGTGSGCIAVTLKLERPDANVTATDISASALELAISNAALYTVEVQFLESDLFENVNGRKYDLIVSNPPYIARGDLLSAEVAEFEPEVALYAENDGYRAYERIAETAGNHLHQGGLVAVEVGQGQASWVANLFESQQFTSTAIYPDLAGIDRVVTAMRR